MAQTTYDDRLKQEFGTIIDSLDIDDRQKQFRRVVCNYSLKTRSMVVSKSTRS